MDFTSTKISLKRSISDYTKVKAIHSWIRRGKGNQLAKPEIKSKEYLNVGCGSKAKQEFINLDYEYLPEVDVCWDITKGLPFKDASIKEIFTEHCLEHISFSNCKFVLREFRRILKPGGSLRIVVPDAELYLNLYHKAKRGEKVEFPSQTPNEVTPIMCVNRIFRNHGHRFAYDAETLKGMLSETSFANVQRVSFMQGCDPKLLIDSESRAAESLYIEASVP